MLIGPRPRVLFRAEGSLALGLRRLGVSFPLGANGRLSLQQIQVALTDERLRNGRSSDRTIWDYGPEFRHKPGHSSPWSVSRTRCLHPLVEVAWTEVLLLSGSHSLPTPPAARLGSLPLPSRSAPAPPAPRASSGPRALSSPVSV